MFIESPRSKTNRRKASLRAQAARTFLNGEKNGRKNSSTLSDSLLREPKFGISATFNKPNIISVRDSPTLCKSSRFDLMKNIDQIVREEREKDKIKRNEKEENISEKIKNVKKELHKNIRREEKGRQNNDNETKMGSENDNVSMKNPEVIPFAHIECGEEKNKNKFKHSSMNKLSDISKRRSDPSVFPNIKLLNPPSITSSK